MKKITQTILTTLFGTLLVACNNGGNSTPSSATPPTTSDIRLSDINLATQILPLKTLDAYPMNANLKSSPNAATFISAESLELTYETLFCQLKTDESKGFAFILIHLEALSLRVRPIIVPKTSLPVNTFTPVAIVSARA